MGLFVQEKLKVEIIKICRMSDHLTLRMAFYDT